MGHSLGDDPRKNQAHRVRTLILFSLELRKLSIVNSRFELILMPDVCTAAGKMDAAGAAERQSRAIESESQRAPKEEESLHGDMTRQAEALVT